MRTNRDKSEKYGWDHGLELFSHDVEDGIFEAIMECDTDMSDHYRAFQHSGEAT